MTSMEELEYSASHLMILQWKLTQLNAVPTDSDVSLDGDAKKLDATVLFAHMKESSVEFLLK